MNYYNEMYFRNNKDCEVKLTELKLHSDSLGYYLSAKYRVEDISSIRELDFPKIRLGVNPNKVGIRDDDGIWSHPKVDIGFGFLELNHQGGRPEVYFTETVIEDKTHEMTIAEIEKKLGYKIKIVGEKE